MIQGWECSLTTLASSIQAKEKNRFLATWLDNESPSYEASEVLNRATDVYMAFYKASAQLNWPQLKISKWDVGWYQVRTSLAQAQLASTSLKDMQAAHKKLGAKIASNLADLGFVQGREDFFAEDNEA